MQVLFVLSWRLGPVLALVIVATASTAALYKQQTKARLPLVSCTA
jgi:ATP-binding cassette subfamily B (MDR/TAP) protein 8